MRITAWQPSRRRFERLFDGESAVPVWAEVEPVPDPLHVFGDARDEYDTAFVLESRGPANPEMARYTIASTSPYLVARSRDGSVTVRDPKRVEVFQEPIQVLRQLLGERPALRIPDQPPFAGGAVGFFGYDLGRSFERLPATAGDDLEADDYCVALFESALVIDRLTGRAKVAATVEPLESAYATYSRTQEVVKDLIKHLSEAPDFPRDEPVCGPLEASCTRLEHEARVESVREYIRAGDVFQVNLSHRLSADFRGDGLALYRSLSECSPAAFAAYLRLPDLKLISASPERFLKVQGSLVRTCPIKGTTRRGHDDREDRELTRLLVADEKERAEHLMTVDLLRNDLGRISKLDRVWVEKLMVVERCPQVIHLVSTIEGILRSDVDPVGVLSGTFPGGSVTGAPKIRAMEIIEELEKTRRGPYTGALGYVSFTGDMDLSIIIRTLVLTQGRVHLQVGGGIVADSVPSREYEETMLKAKGLMAALKPTAALPVAAGI